MRVGGVDATAREDVDIRGEGHRWRPTAEQHLEARPPRAEQHQGRGGDRLDGLDRFGHASGPGSTGGSGASRAAASSVRSASGVVTGRRQTNPRQT